MKTASKLILATIALISVAVTAPAQQITFGGLTWDTVPREHRDHPGVFSEYTATGPNSATIRGVYNGGDAGDSVMTASLSLLPGYRVSYDFYLSNNGNNIPDFNGGTWFGDLGFVFQTSPTVPNFQNWSTDRIVTTWANRRDEVGIGGSKINDGTDLMTGGVHADWLFNANEYTVTLTSLANSATTVSFTQVYWEGTTGPTDIQGIRVGLYDSEQTLTIDNFIITVPEPSSLALLGIGAAGLIVARRRRS